MYRNGVMDKYQRISGAAQAEACREVGITGGFLIAGLDAMDMETLKKGDAFLEKINPYLDILATDAVWMVVSKLLDNQMVQQHIWDSSKKSITQKEVPTIPERLKAVAFEIIESLVKGQGRAIGKGGEVMASRSSDYRGKFAAVVGEKNIVTDAAAIEGYGSAGVLYWCQTGLYPSGRSCRPGAGCGALGAGI